jgi:molybdopterin-dependent oxidoreductase alpha subunit
MADLPPNSPATPIYDGPAGGWGALLSTGRHVWRGGALLRCSKALLQVNQPKGFDCPGCAWPEPPHGTPFEFCENGAKAVAWESTARRADAAFFAAHTVSELRTWSDFQLEDSGRLCEPMAYNANSDRYEPIAWEAAFAQVAAALKALPSPRQAAFYTSGRTSNEAAFLYQLFGRYLGHNNFPDCSNMCHESSGVALKEVIGVGKGTVTLADFMSADAIFIIGQNPGSNHPRMLGALEAAAKRGCRIVSINPLIERGIERFIHPQHVAPMLTGQASQIGTHYLQPLIGGDLAVLKGLCKWVLQMEDAQPGTVLDQTFLAEQTYGFTEFAADLRATSWDEIETQSGVTRAELRPLAEVYAKAKAVIVCWAMGLTQQKHAVPTIQFVVNLLLMRGNLGRPGAGACPVRGHSNVQGDRTMGIAHDPPAGLLTAMQKRFHFTPPPEHGLDTVATIHAMEAGEIGVFIGLGGNFVRATPDTPRTTVAIQRCALTVHIATKLNHCHLAHGRASLILPCLGRTEIDRQASGPQEVTVEDSMSMVHASRGNLEPASPQLRSEPAIVAGMAEATLGKQPVDWSELVADYRRIRALIAACVPGFTDFEARVTQPGGFYLGNSARDRLWVTATGRAQFTLAAVPNMSLPEGQLRLMTMRSHDQYNTTIYGYRDRYRGIEGTREVVLLHADDLAARGLQPGDLVDLRSHWPDGRERIVRGWRALAYAIPRGCAGAYFPEANILVPLDSVADKSNCPTSKFIAITISPTQGMAH